MDRLEEITFREHQEIMCRDRMHATEIVNDERDKRYMDRFEAIEEHTQRALAALNGTHQNMLSIAGILLAIGAILLHFVK